MTANGKTQSSGYAHAYHERVLNDVLRSSQGYEHKTRRDVGNGGSERSREIRERIAANAQRRYEIAEAMKSEAIHALALKTSIPEA